MVFLFYQKARGESSNGGYSYNVLVQELSSAMLAASILEGGLHLSECALDWFSFIVISYLNDLEEDLANTD